MSTSTPAPTQPGWYDDPQAPGQQRWFDGQTWSPFTKEGSAGPAAVVPQPHQAVDPVAAVTAAGAWAPAGADGARASGSPAGAGSPWSDLAPAAPTRPAATPPAAARATSPRPARPVASAPHSAPITSSAPATVEAFTVRRPVDRASTRPATPLRRLVGRAATGLPAWLPESIAAPLRTWLGGYASRTDRWRDRLTRDELRRLVLPEGSAWQGSVAACLGVVTLALSVWPVAGLGAWALTCAFAGWALLRIRRDVLLGGRVHAWFGIACGIGPLWTGLLMVAYR